MNIVVDYISSMNIVNGVAIYTGGTNYSKNIIKLILESQCEFTKMTILIPKGLSLLEDDKKLFMNERCQICIANSLKEFDYSNSDLLFMPVVNGKTLSIISSIKKRFPRLRIYATLHDRQHNFTKYDWWDRYYYNGIQRIFFVGYVKYIAKRIAFDYEFYKNARYLDKIFTVSNYSMQKLNDTHIKKIKYFVQGNYLNNYVDKKPSQRGDYIFFCGGGRPEKNLLRALCAYEKYYNYSEKKYKMIVTGIKDQTVQNLMNSHKFHKEIILNNVKFYNYVSYAELAELYGNCRYSLFLSKGEGYGLPVRESLSFGKTLIASSLTSIPEVAGSILEYVNPFDITAISKCMLRLDDDVVVSKMEYFIQKRELIIEETANNDSEVFLHELMN